MKLHFDKQKCTGCCACQMACMDQRDIRPLQGQTSLCRIEALERTGQLYYRFVHCVQCGKCSEVCPTECLYQDSRGLILANTTRCIQCKACQEACPMNVISFDPDTGTVVKCDGCIGRIEDGRLPACVHTCPTGALTLVTD